MSSLLVYFGILSAFFIVALCLFSRAFCCVCEKLLSVIIWYWNLELMYAEKNIFVVRLLNLALLSILNLLNFFSLFIMFSYSMLLFPFFCKTIPRYLYYLQGLMLFIVGYFSNVFLLFINMVCDFPMLLFISILLSFAHFSMVSMIISRCFWL